MEKLLLTSPPAVWRGPVRALGVTWIGVETVEGRGADRSALRARRSGAYPISPIGGSGGLAFEDGGRLLRVVDDERGRRRISPRAEGTMVVAVQFFVGLA